MNPLGKLYRIPFFIAYYVFQLIVANLRITLDVMTPGLKMTPGFIKIPLSVCTDAELLIFANLVSMTPGTLSVDVSPDRRFLYVHAVYLDDPESVRRQLTNNLQRRVLEAMR